MEKNFYITTTAPYVNAEPHIGFAFEIVTADVIARYHHLLGKKVGFNTGTDEHGLKIYQEALAKNVEPQVYVDTNAKKFKDLIPLLNLSVTHFNRTTNPHHIEAAQAFWLRCDKNGDIYKKNYKTKYCVGCELEKTDSDLVNNRCPLHPNRQLEMYEEENYFFRFSRYQKKLLKLYEDNPRYVLPESKYKEIISFVSRGINDFSISRLKSKLPWGVEVPGDNSQVMYVWFDALIYYISSLGWPKDTKQFKAYWPGMQIAGKDNLRQQSAMWQAMLMSAGLPNSTQILINGFISVNGQKMSKSLGNVISPQEMVDRFGVDGTRYLLVNLGPVHEDIDISWDKLVVRYNNGLANGLGNTVARIAKLCQQSGFDFPPDTPPGFRSQVKNHLDDFRFDRALEVIWQTLKDIDQKIEGTKPWQLKGQALKIKLTAWVAHLRQVGYELQPFLPATAQKIIHQFIGPKIESKASLFPRLNP
ncbi:methionine--tRNA ligase [Microgenomates group bacterium RIFCSPHIGHO2_01_FULL_45_11]|nr:MAG: methionine--tRNA ligase [Microgenomates group bacterium RIFCSPHIGHO2_01_FULL_45_11]